MKVGRGIGGLALTLLALLVIPAHSAATDSAPPLVVAFNVQASHGYSIVALGASKRADGRGAIVLFVERGRESATYEVPAQVSAAGIEADLGSLGKISLTVAPRAESSSFVRGVAGGPNRMNRRFTAGSSNSTARMGTPTL